MSTKRLRVGVSGHDLKFWHPLQAALEATGRYEFRADKWSGHDKHDESASMALIDWADVLICEWSLGNAVFYSRRKRPSQRLVVRFHLQERNTRFPEAIAYPNVDSVVFVGSHILAECRDRFSIPDEKCVVIGNAVDVRRYDHAKLGGADYTLGMIGINPARKRLDLALDTLETLLRKDPNYVLRVKGANPASIGWLWARSEERHYYRELFSRINSGPLRHKVIFDPQGEDVHHWLRMVSFILSPSDFESFHMAVAEGAASGARLIVWNWEGAQEIYPGMPVVSSPTEAAELIAFLNQSAAGTRYRIQMRQLVQERYDMPVIKDRWHNLLSAGREPAAGFKRSARKDRAILVVWAIDNWQTFHRREMLTALASNVRDEFELIIVEPGNHVSAVLNRGWATEAELARIARAELIQEGENIARTRLLTSGFTKDVQRRSYQGSSRNPLEILDGLIEHHFGANRRVVQWVYKPNQAARMSGRPFIYEVYDEYCLDFATGVLDEETLKLEETALGQAEHVFFTSKPLMDRKGSQARSSSLIGNGVRFDAFADRRPATFAAPGRAVVGYLGNLSGFFDWGLMLDVAKGLPDVDFVLHGQIEEEKLGRHTGTLEELTELPNVFFTGRVNREIGAAAVARYDVLIIPFVVNDAMHAVNPLKLWEYFAAGRPVVSTPIDALSIAHPLVTIADCAEEWIAAIKRCLSEDAADDKAATARMALARAHDWHALTSGHAEVLKDLVKRLVVT